MRLVRPAALALLTLLGAACAGDGGAEPPPPDQRAVQAVRAVTLSFAELESCLHGTRDEMPPAIDPEAVRLRTLGIAARAAKARLSGCDVQRGEASVLTVEGVEGELARRSAALGRRMAEAARDARSTLDAFISSVLEYAEGAPGADRLVREQARLNDDFHEALERLERVLALQIEVEARLAG